MKSPVVKRSIVVAGHKTSVSLEEAFWNGMKEISGLRDMTLSELVGEIDSNRQQGNLSSAIRLFVLDYFRTRCGGRAARIQNPQGSDPGMPIGHGALPCDHPVDQSLCSQSLVYNHSKVTLRPGRCA